MLEKDSRPDPLSERFPKFWDMEFLKTKKHLEYRYARLGHINPDFRVTHPSEAKNPKKWEPTPESKREISDKLETVLRNRVPPTVRPPRYNRSTLGHE